MPKSLVISDESINSYGFYLLTSGGDLSQFKKNPILLWMHNRSWRGTKDEVLPIGTIENVRVEGDRVLGDPVFDEEDEFAAEIGRKWEAGILRMCSAGIKTIEVSEDPKYIKSGQTRRTVTKWKLREVSIVDIGSNDNALALYDEDDKLITLSNDPEQEIPIAKLVDNHKNDDNMDEIRLADGRKLNATQVQQLSDQVTEKDATITTLTAERDDLKTKVDTFKQKEKDNLSAEATTLVNAAVKDGRIDATPNKEGKSPKENWMKFFESDHEGAKLALASIPKRAKVTTQLSDGGNESELEQLTKLSWDELDHGNKLGTVKDKYWDLYESKFEEKFGSKPKKQA